MEPLPKLLIKGDGLSYLQTHWTGTEQTHEECKKVGLQTRGVSMPNLLHLLMEKQGL